MGLRENEEAILLLKTAIEELEKPQVRVSSSLSRILRAAKLVGSKNLIAWCKIQFGDIELITPIKKFIEAAIEEQETGIVLNITQELIEELLRKGIDFSKDLSIDEINIKTIKSGGGWNGIEYIEDLRDTLIKYRQGSSGEYYLTNLKNTIAFVRREAHSRAVKLYHNLEFSTSVKSTFEILKNEVDDKLLKLVPELGEKLMLIFENVSSGRENERWSQSLTSCRRLIKELADKLNQPKKELLNGRKVGETQYINRIWAFMDSAIESERNKVLAKSHIELLGFYLESSHDLSHKGVHAEVTHFEAVRIVFHIYLALADILMYLDVASLMGKKPLPSIYSLSRDELIKILKISNEIADNIIKLRVKNNKMSLSDLKEIKGVGQKTIERIENKVSLVKRKNTT